MPTSFRTEWTLPKGKFLLNHQQNILLMGSCFSENIGHRLQKYKFVSLINPFGILFNPASITQALELMDQQEIFTEDDLLFFEEKWLSLFHHTQFSHTSRTHCLSAINSAFATGSTLFKKLDCIIITLGTAFVYEYKKTHTLVANCHKIPAQEFNRKLLDLTEICAYLERAIIVLKKQNPAIKILFTVSPVRHWKDGVLDNQKSKSLLHLAVRHFSEQDDTIDYFPAYELMMDDLRDYRFYEADMLHPNKMAVDYIWEKFTASHTSDKTQILLTKLQKINRSLQHRPRHIGTKKHQDFLQNLWLNLEVLQKEYAFLNLEKERIDLKAKISQAQQGFFDDRV